MEQSGTWGAGAALVWAERREMRRREDVMRAGQAWQGRSWSLSERSQPRAVSYIRTLMDGSALMLT